MHRDLACRNVLVGKNRCCKIADLGLARFLDGDGTYRREKNVCILSLKVTFYDILQAWARCNRFVFHCGIYLDHRLQSGLVIEVTTL